MISDRMGFNVAFGITSFDGSSEFIEDPSIGVFEAYYRTYGAEEDPYNLSHTLLNTHLCRPEDFNLDSDWNYSTKLANLTALSEEQQDVNSDPFFFPPKES